MSGDWITLKQKFTLKNYWNICANLLAGTEFLYQLCVTQITPKESLQHYHFTERKNLLFHRNEASLLVLLLAEYSHGIVVMWHLKTRPTCWWKRFPAIYSFLTISAFKLLHIFLFKHLSVLPGNAGLKLCYCKGAHDKNRHFFTTQSKAYCKFQSKSK